MTEELTDVLRDVIAVLRKKNEAVLADRLMNAAVKSRAADREISDKLHAARTRFVKLDYEVQELKKDIAR